MDGIRRNGPMAGREFNWMVDKAGDATIVIGRDPWIADRCLANRETEEDRKEGFRAISDWPILNALVNTAEGHWVSFHHGGGVGIAYSLEAGWSVWAMAPVHGITECKRVITRPGHRASFACERLRDGRPSRTVSERGVDVQCWNSMNRFPGQFFSRIICRAVIPGKFVFALIPELAG